MPTFRTGSVTRLRWKRPGLQRVEVDGEPAYVLTDLIGPVGRQQEHAVTKSLHERFDEGVVAGRTQVKDRHPRIPGRRWARGLLLLALGSVTVLFLYPFVWLVAASFKPRSEVFDNRLIPKTFTQHQRKRSNAFCSLACTKRRDTPLVCRRTVRSEQPTLFPISWCENPWRRNSII